MITGVSHITIFVHNQDEALAFYTQKMGFDVHTDAMFGTERWLTICPKTNRNLEITLVQATDKNNHLVGKQAGELPFLSFSTDDCHKTYQELSSKGVEFTQKPVTEPWGVSAMFKDLYGNIFYLNQPA